MVEVLTKTKKFIDALAYMNSVNYVVKNDIPSQLLEKLSENIRMGHKHIINHQ